MSNVEEYKAAVVRYNPDAEETVIAGIVKQHEIALRSKDASLVSCSSKDELARVRDSWLRKKMGLSEDDATLDAAIKDVCETMKADRRKQRVTFYYLLLQKFNKTDMFA